MRQRKPIGSFAPHEIQRFLLPITLAFICIIAWAIIEHFINDAVPSIALLSYGLVGILAILTNNYLIIRNIDYHENYGRLNSILSGIWLGLFVYVSPNYLSEASHILILLGVVAIAVASGRFDSYLTMLLSLAIGLPFIIDLVHSLQAFLELSMPYIAGVVIVEAVIRIKNTTQQHIHRLETINRISRQIMLSLETHQTISLLNETLQEALEADTYFVGVMKDNEIQLDLFYDDGEYFNGTRVPLDGTLSGWVVKNQRELFLPDLREDVQLDGVNMVVIGKDKTSLSWMGVPLKATNVTGIISLASYRSNAFDSGDMELLSNLAQHVSLALDNAIRHAQVEEQARLDSLTGVFNHGYFLRRLLEQAQEASASGSPLSLIMLDIDYFKQFNDTHGHLVGDRILKTLCTAIKHHTKQTDAVGRWGGEEFVISLPGATGSDAFRVAERIGQTMALLQVENREQQAIHVPTVSQGIAMFSLEANGIYRLVDLADRRLYIAKERGRNQIEPTLEYWETLSMG